MPLPFTVGYDFSGTIHEVDEADSSKYPYQERMYLVSNGDKASMMKMINHVVEHLLSMLQYLHLD